MSSPALEAEVNEEMDPESRGESPCRHCGTALRYSLVDLGSSPPCNSLLTDRTLHEGETFYPLNVRVCDNCFLAQLEELVSPEDIFTEYSYFSSFSDLFVAHAKRFVEASIPRFGLSGESRVFEVASNDGYLLQHFLPHGIPVLGIEPALNVAEAARAKGVDTISEFLGEETARAIVAERGTANLVVGNNVMAHTPFLNDFVGGLAILAGGEGVVSVEFPHLMRLIDGNQFDTIYHEHFSYFSFFTVDKVFRSKGLRIFDVEELPVHGGSLRVLATRAGADRHPETPAVQRLHEAEADWGVTDLATYSNFGDKVARIKCDLLFELIRIRREGKQIAGYGAPGKGNTLLNYFGIRSDLLSYLVDRNPYKQGNYAPGSRIPIVAPERIFETKPDYVLIMIWNLLDEVIEQMQGIRDWGGKFLVAIPEVRIVE